MTEEKKRTVSGSLPWDNTETDLSGIKEASSLSGPGTPKRQIKKDPLSSSENGSRHDAFPFLQERRTSVRYSFRKYPALISAESQRKLRDAERLKTRYLAAG